MFEVKEKPKMVESAFLVGVRFPENSHDEVANLLAELEELVNTLGIGVSHGEIVRLKEPKPQFLLGSGKTEEIIRMAKERDCDCIVFDNELSPAQQRNWEQESGLCVIDRQEVILDIFAERAQTKEAVLQVDLARMEYSLPRLRRAWTHLSRQRGGGVTQRGEGEAQIELDQRMVRTRIAKLKRELADVVKQREVQRSQRQRVPVPTAAIVGYTNAGKSSLLRHLTQANVLVEDKLFATLDPTTRRLKLPGGQTLLLTDTVGFIRRLPHDLVEAFKATLEEAIASDFLIHVLDVTSPDVERHRQTTLRVLKELGADEKRIVTVLNKIDLADRDQVEEVLIHAHEKVICVSAKTGEGIEPLLKTLEEMLHQQVRHVELLIPHSRYDVINRLYTLGSVKERKELDTGVYLRGIFPTRIQNEFMPFIHVNGVNGHSPVGEEATEALSG